MSTIFSNHSSQRRSSVSSEQSKSSTLSKMIEMISQMTGSRKNSINTINPAYGAYVDKNAFNIDVRTHKPIDPRKPISQKPNNGFPLNSLRGGDSSREFRGEPNTSNRRLGLAKTNQILSKSVVNSSSTSSRNSRPLDSRERDRSISTTTTKVIEVSKPILDKLSSRINLMNMNNNTKSTTDESENENEINNNDHSNINGNNQKIITKIKVLCCDKCDGKHETDDCPYYKKQRDEHPDAKRNKNIGGNSTLPGSLIRNARIVRQPGDGSCLFHSMSYGLKNGYRADKLRSEICEYIRTNPKCKISDTELNEWIKWDSKISCNDYARKMSSGTWGGGIEMAVTSILFKCNIHVYERCFEGYKRISAFDYPESPEKLPIIRVLYCGGVHYGKFDHSDFASL